MANFNDAIVITLAKEGGAKFTDVPNDRGGQPSTVFRKLLIPPSIFATLPNNKPAIFINGIIGTAYAVTILNRKLLLKTFLIPP
jgi:hypothetical protein